MSKFSTAFALGIGLAVSLAASPTVLADKIIQPLAPQDMTASQFNELFKPLDNTPALTSNYQFMDSSSPSGVIRSQVFQGQAGTAAEGLYAYGYQLGVAAPAAGSDPQHLDSVSFRYGDTPQGVDLLNTGTDTYTYAIKDGSIGSLVLPQTADGSPVRLASVSWQPGDTFGILRGQFVDPSTNTPPLDAGSDSATFIVLSKHLFNTQYVNFQSDMPTTGDPASVYAATGGEIRPVPIPEPATFLAWSGMGAALLLVRRVRKVRAAA